MYRSVGFIGVFLLAGNFAAACDGTAGTERTRREVTTAPAARAQTKARARADWSLLLPWGSGPDRVGLRPARREQLAQGAAAVALGPAGAVYVLDQLNGRVLQVAPRGREVAPAPVHATDLAVGPLGALAVYSPFAARVWIHDQGALLGEVAVPRALRQIRGISLGASRVVTAHHALQETFPLGSPAAPRALAAILHGKREGACQLASGAGVAVVLDQDRQPEVRVLGMDRDGRSRTVRSFVIERPVLAARIVGAVGRTVCLRLERRGAGRGFTVARQAVCLDTQTGERVLERDLPAPGQYLPRRELAVGDDPPRLGFIHPEPDGLRVTVFGLAEGVVR